MWLLLLMICVMPFEQSPYLMIADSFLGIFQDFTVIKALGLVGCGWALLRVASGNTDEEGILTSLQAKLFVSFFAGVIVSSLLSGSGFLIVSKYLAFLFFLPFVLVSVKTQDDLRRVLYAMAGTLILIFPYAYRQSLRFGDRLGVGLSETNYFAANLVLVLPLAFAIALQQRTPGGRRMWLLGSGVLLLALGAFGPASRLHGSPEAEELAGWGEGLRAGFVGFAVAGTFISAEYEKYFWVVIFLSIVVDRLIRRREAVAAAAADVPATEPTAALAPTR